MNDSPQLISPSHFEKVRQLGSGSSGKVYLANQKTTKRQYAIKFIKTELTENSVITAKIGLISQMQHPAILKIFGYSMPDQSKNRPMSIVCEYQSNGSLLSLLDTPGNLTDFIKMKVLFGVAEAMRFIHENKFSHGNLTPNNILINQNWEPLLCDYLLDKIAPQQKKFTLCSLSFFAPEFQDNFVPSKEADIFSYGMIVYSVISGKLPWNKLPIDAKEKIKNGERPPLTDNIPECWQHLISQCWDNDPNKRPSFESIVLRFIKNEFFLPLREIESLKFRNYQTTILSSSFSTKVLINTLNQIEELTLANKSLNRIVESLKRNVESLSVNMTSIQQKILANKEGNLHFANLSDERNKMSSNWDKINQKRRFSTKQPFRPLLVNDFPKFSDHNKPNETNNTNNPNIINQTETNNNSIGIKIPEKIIDENKNQESQSESNSELMPFPSYNNNNNNNAQEPFPKAGENAPLSSNDKPSSNGNTQAKIDDINNVGDSILANQPIPPQIITPLPTPVPPQHRQMSFTSPSPSASQIHQSRSKPRLSLQIETPSQFHPQRSNSLKKRKFSDADVPAKLFASAINPKSQSPLMPQQRNSKDTGSIRMSMSIGMNNNNAPSPFTSFTMFHSQYQNPPQSSDNSSKEGSHDGSSLSKKSTKSPAAKNVLMKELPQNVQYPYAYAPFDGIFAHLTSEVNGNLMEKGIVQISGNSADKNRESTIHEIINFEWNKCWTSANEPNSYILFDFGVHQVCLTHYTIKTYLCGAGYSHLKNWVIEGSNSGQWYEIDRRDDNNELNGKSKVATFQVATTGDFQMIRLRQTGPNHYGDNYLILTNVEFFGDFI